MSATFSNNSKVRFPIRFKILGTYALVLVLLALLVVSSVRQMEEVNQRLQVIEDGYLPAINKLSSIGNLYYLQENFDLSTLQKNRSNKLFIESIRFSYPKLVSRNLGEIQDVVRITVLEQMSLIKGSSANDKRQIQAILGAISNVSVAHSEYNAAIKEILAGGQVAEDALASFRDRFQNALRVLDSRLNLALQEEMRLIGRLEKRGTWFIVVLSVLGVLVVLLLALISLVILSPIQKLTEGAQRISEGDFSHRVKLKSGDEMGILAEEFNNMASSLVDRTNELIESERLATIGKLSSQVTHEIRNPLHAIGLNLEVLQEDLGGQADDNTKKIIRSIEMEIKRLNTVAESYLQMARPAKKIQEECVLQDLLDETLSLIKEDLQRKNIRLTRDFDESLIKLRLDPNQLKQALLNLVRNAAEALESSGDTINVKMKQVKDKVTISVSDNGPGLDPKAMQKVFGAFYTTKETGTGLGLSITRKIVQDLGGTINADNIPGGGAAFVMEFDAIGR